MPVPRLPPLRSPPAGRVGVLARMRVRTKLLVLVLLPASALLAFASVGIYALAIALLFAAGFFELSFNTMAQALVQINAPADIRGRVVGLFNMAGLGMRAFSGITVGLAGAAIGIHWSLGVSAAVLLVFLSVLYRRAASGGKSPSQVSSQV